MRIFLSIAAATAITVSAVPALAAPSNASFSYSGGPYEGLVNLRVETISGETLLTSLRRGWVAETGANNGGPGDVGNYIVGRCGSSDACGGDDLERNNYFQFDVSGLGDATVATLELRQPLNAFGSSGLNGYLGPQASHIYTLFDVFASLDGGVDLFDDLRNGDSFGSVMIDETSNGTIVSVILNSSGLFALQQAAGGDGLFNLGGTLNLGSVVGVPEPTSWAMLIAGFGLVGAVARRRNKGLTVTA